MSNTIIQYARDQRKIIESMGTPSWPETTSDIVEDARNQRKVLEQMAGESAVRSDIYSYYKKWAGDGRPLTKGECVLYNGELYRVDESHCSQENWTPDSCVLFSKRPATTEICEWVQPIDEGYKYGDCVYHGGHTWESVYAGLNVWEPGMDENETLWRKVN